MSRTTSLGSSWAVVATFVGAVGLAGWAGCSGSDFTAAEPPPDAAAGDASAGSAGQGGASGTGGTAGSTSQGGAAGTSGTGGIAGTGGTSKDASEDSDADVSEEPSDGGEEEAATDGTIGPDACGAGTKFCTDACVNINIDPNNCGACDVKCIAAHADSSCSNGACTFKCQSGHGDCDGQDANGCEAALSTLENCGACGTTCSMLNGVASCTTGNCELSSCNPGYANCNGAKTDGCEVNLHTLDNCGACGTKCQSDGGSTMTCATGVCLLDSCVLPYAECDGNLSTQCETPLNTTDNCGSCGNHCSFPNAGAKCTNYACALDSCNSGFGNCDANASNGCETNLSNNNLNCGGCGTICSFAHATGACNTGTCVIATCDAGWTDCDGDKINGCEVHTDVNPANCGACGLVCSIPHATAACAAGSCIIGSCESGWANCNGNASDGCEIHISVDPQHCGSCTGACPAYAHGQALCAVGVCDLGACDPGWGNCDGNDGNGCETDTQANVSNCGMCGKVCVAGPHSIAGCVAGNCTVAGCVNGYGDCDGVVADGCEADIKTDELNCGQCGRPCVSVGVATLDCQAGVCSSVCKYSVLNCSQPVVPAADNGCETSESASQCGSCGNTCLNGFKCVTSNCACDWSLPSSCGMGTCSNATGNCSCTGPVVTAQCNRGETCIPWSSGTGGSGGSGGMGGMGGSGLGGTGGTGSLYSKCSCPAAGAPCMSPSTCCSAGCRNLGTDANNCGACGHKCPDGFICFEKAIGMGACQCDADADCNNGTPGTCNQGVCECAGTKCALSQRCLSSGTCG